MEAAASLAQQESDRALRTVLALILLGVADGSVEMSTSIAVFRF